MTDPRPVRDSLQRSMLRGFDAALIAIALAMMYALIVYATLGRAAAPLALKTVIAAFVIGGGIAMMLAREIPMVCGPAATSALIVSAMIGQLAAAGDIDGGFGIVLVATSLAGIVAGLVPLALAAARLGAVLKFIPYPVMMGFVNSIGVSFVVSVAPFALGHDYPGRIVDAAAWSDGWRPAALGVTAIGTAAGYAAIRLVPHAPATFIALVSATIAHHVVAAVCPGCALGPLLAFDAGGPLPGWGAAWASRPRLGPTEWTLILQAGLTLGILNSVFSMMSAAALTRAHDATVDGNRLLAKIGSGTVASSLALGLPVAIVASATRAVRDPAGRSSAALFTYLIATTALLGLAHGLFAAVPMAAVASAVFVIARTQFDLSTWPLVRQALRGGNAAAAARGPLTIAFLVVAIAVVRSFAAALFVGAIAAVCLLAIDLRRSVIHSIGDGLQRRSRRVWTAAERAALDAAGDQIRVIELAHWLYFGTADELARILDDQKGARWLLIDARRVAGIDLTAARSLVHAAQRVAARGSHLVLAGIPETDARLRTLVALRTTQIELASDVDAALERAELDLLGAMATRDDPGASLPGLDAGEVERLDRWLEPFVLRAGDPLFRAGDPGGALFIVREGRITLSIDGDGRRIRLSTFGPGGIFGEMALLDGHPRSAHADAEQDSVLAMLTRERLDALATADPVLHARLLRSLTLQLIGLLRASTSMLQKLA